MYHSRGVFDSFGIQNFYTRHDIRTWKDLVRNLWYGMAWDSLFNLYQDMISAMYVLQPPITHVLGTYPVHLQIPKGGGGRIEGVESSRRSWKGDRVAKVQGEHQSIPPCMPTETAAPTSSHSVNSTSLHPRRSTPTLSSLPPLDIFKTKPGWLDLQWGAPIYPHPFACCSIPASQLPNHTIPHHRKSAFPQHIFPTLDSCKNWAWVAWFVVGCSNPPPSCALSDTCFPVSEPHLPHHRMPLPNEFPLPCTRCLQKLSLCSSVCGGAVQSIPLLVCHSISASWLPDPILPHYRRLPSTLKMDLFPPSCISPFQQVGEWIVVAYCT